MYHSNLNVGLMSKNVTEIKNGIRINIGANLKILHKKLCVQKRLYFESCYM